MNVQPILHWLLTEARLLTDAGALLDGLGPRLSAAGYPILRSNVQVRTQHPEVSMRLVAWRRATVGAGAERTEAEVGGRSVVGERFVPLQMGVVQEVDLDHTAFLNPRYFNSPFRPVTEQLITVHCPISPTQISFEYTLLADLQAMGATDYLCMPLAFPRGPASGISWATDRPGGFDAAFLTALELVVPAIALCMELHSSRHITRSLLHTYVGQEPGELVLAGQFHCGDVKQIQAALWFSDLRGFTTLSSQLTSAELVATLNDYFGAISPALAAHGGEVLKYIGDAILAVFPIRAGREAAAACADAVAAAVAACDSLQTLNTKRQSGGRAPLDHGIGLHFGEAEYGNIDAPGRLDFTVIGRDVNLASRIEGLCGKLGQRVLLSQRMAEQVPGRAVQAIGSFELKGIEGAQQVFALA